MRDRLSFHHGDLSGRLLNTWKQAGQSKRRPYRRLILPMVGAGDFEPANFFSLAEIGIIIRELGQQHSLRLGLFSELSYEPGGVRDKPTMFVLVIVPYHH